MAIERPDEAKRVEAFRPSQTTTGRITTLSHLLYEDGDWGGYLVGLVDLYNDLEKGVEGKERNEIGGVKNMYDLGRKIGINSYKLTHRYERLEEKIAELSHSEDANIDRTIGFILSGTPQEGRNEFSPGFFRLYILHVIILGLNSENLGKAAESVWLDEGKEIKDMMAWPMINQFAHGDMDTFTVTNIIYEYGLSPLCPLVRKGAGLKPEMILPPSVREVIIRIHSSKGRLKYSNLGLKTGDAIKQKIEERPQVAREERLQHAVHSMENIESNYPFLEPHRDVLVEIIQNSYAVYLRNGGAKGLTDALEIFRERIKQFVRSNSNRLTKYEQITFLNVIFWTKKDLIHMFLYLRLYGYIKAFDERQ